MLIGGFQKFSLIDYPGKICAIVFTQGCNFRCPYCHNPELIEFSTSNKISEEEIFSFLKKRARKLDGVEITGGEPTLHKDLIDFIKKIKDMGFLIKLDSNGSNPDVVERAINEGVVNYLAMDIKAPLEKYKKVTNCNVDLNKIKDSISLIMNSGINYELRTTVVKSQLRKKDVLKIGESIKGAELYILQKFHSFKSLDPKFLKEESYSNEEFEDLKNELKEWVNECWIRT